MDESRIGVAAILVALTTLSAAAADIPGPTLDEAIASAIERNDALLAADAALAAAEAGVDAAGARRLPRVVVEESVSYSTNPTLVFSNLLGQEAFGPENFEIDALNRPDALSNWGTGLSVAVPVYTGGALAASVAAAEASREATRSRRERTRQETVRDVVAAYTGVSLAEAQLEVARKSRETADENVRFVTDLFDAGLVVESDVLSARVRLAEVEEMTIRAESEVATAAAALNLVMGRPLDAPARVVAPAAADHEDEEPLGALLAEATTRRPDLGAADASVTAAERHAAASRGALLPEVGLAGRVEANAEDFVGADGSNWSVFATVRFPLFDPTARAGLREARQRSLEASHRRNLLRRSVELEVRQRFFARRAAIKSLEQADLAEGLAAEGLRMVQDRYREGLATIVELLDAESSWTRARTRKVAAEREVRLADAMLDLAVGRL